MEKNGLLYHRFQNGKLFEDHVDQLVVREVLRNDILEKVHGGVTGGHLGEQKTMYKIRQRVF